MGKWSFVSMALTVVGAIGVAATAYAAVKCAPKAEERIEEARQEKGEELTKIEVVKAATPAYIPAIAAGATAITCIIGSHAMSRKQQAALAGAFTTAGGLYTKYSDKVKELFGEEADLKIKTAVAEDVYNEYEPFEDDGEEQLFYDYNNRQYFTSTIDHVLQKTVMDDGLECYIICTPFDVSLDRWPFE